MLLHMSRAYITALPFSFSDALPFSLAIAGVASGWFAARYSSRAPFQSALNDAFRLLMEELQEKRAQDTALISEQADQITILEAKMLKMAGEAKTRNMHQESEILRQRGVIDSKIQRERSLIRFIERSGLTPPSGRTAEKEEGD